MKAEAMKLVATGLIDVIRRHVAETRETLMARIHASEAVANDQRIRLDELEAEVRELQARLQVRRVA